MTRKGCGCSVLRPGDQDPHQTTAAPPAAPSSPPVGAGKQASDLTPARPFGEVSSEIQGRTGGGSK